MFVSLPVGDIGPPDDRRTTGEHTAVELGTLMVAEGGRGLNWGRPKCGRASGSVRVQVGTGEFKVTEGEGQSSLVCELLRLNPAEATPHNTHECSACD